MKKTKIIYIGRRLDGQGKIHHAFLHRKEEVYWSGVKGIFIGSTYWANVKGKDLTLSRRPERLPDDDAIKFTDAELDAWNVRDALTGEELAQRRERNRAKAKAKKLGESKRVKELKREIHALTKNMSYFDREYFVQHLTRGAK